ncbi:TPA: XRE family transcriptional regulator, partial [Streptococcus agalactiae]|nr:XRE family transcriptional regulator [Streptococcus agalactiae]
AKILADYFGVSIPYLLGFETKIPINTNTEIFKQLKSINQLKSQLLSELLDLDNQEKELFSKLNE